MANGTQTQDPIAQGIIEQEAIEEFLPEITDNRRVEVQKFMAQNPELRADFLRDPFDANEVLDQMKGVNRSRRRAVGEALARLNQPRNKTADIVSNVGAGLGFLIDRFTGSTRAKQEAGGRLREFLDRRTAGRQREQQTKRQEFTDVMALQDAEAKQKFGELGLALQVGQQANQRRLQARTAIAKAVKAGTVSAKDAREMSAQIDADKIFAGITNPDGSMDYRSLTQDQKRRLREAGRDFPDIDADVKDREVEARKLIWPEYKARLEGVEDQTERDAIYKLFEADVQRFLVGGQNVQPEIDPTDDRPQPGDEDYNPADHAPAEDRGFTVGGVTLDPSVISEGIGGLFESNTTKTDVATNRALLALKLKQVVDFIGKGGYSGDILSELGKLPKGGGGGTTGATRQQ